MSDTIFDRLVSEISENERSELLDELSRSMSASGGNDLFDRDDDLEVDESEDSLRHRIRSLGLFKRLWLFLRSVFAGRSQDEIYERDLLRSLGKRVERTAPGLIDSSHSNAQPQLYNRFRDLEQAARVCHELVGPIAGPRKGDFLSYLLEMEHYETRIRFENELYPQQVAAQYPDASDTDLKRRLESNLEDIVSYIPPDARKRMYLNAKYLDNLRGLAMFDFPRLFALFHSGHAGEVDSCSLVALSGYLERLVALFEGLRIVPGDVMVQAMYSYLRLRGQDSGNADSAETSDYNLRRFSTAIAKIGEFGNEVPLLALARLANETVRFEPVQAGGGEDWLALIRKFWLDRIESLHSAYVFGKRRRDLLERAANLCEVSVGPLPDYRAADPDVPGKFADALGVIRAFMTNVFQPKLHGTLRLVQVNGQFYKDANRAEFNDAFETLRAVGGRVSKFMSDVSPDGTTGKALTKVDREQTSQEKRREEREKLLVLTNKNAEQIVSDTVSAMRSVCQVVNGILYGEVGGAFDTLSNLNSIDGRNSERFHRTLDSVLVTLKAAEELISLSYDLATMNKPKP